MRVTGRAGLILVSSFALAGAALAAGTSGTGDKIHNLMVALPDGSVRHFRYTGDVVPQVMFVPAHAVVAPVAMLDDFDAPFAEMDRLAAEMDRQSDAMLRQAALLATRSGKAVEASPAVFGRLPVGSFSYSFVSTSTGNGTCSQSMQVTSYGPNQKPKVIQQTSGNCSAVQNRAIPNRALPATQVQPDRALPKLLPAKLDRSKLPAAVAPADRI